MAYFGIFPPDYLNQFSYVEQEQGWRDFLNAGLDDVLLVAESERGEVIGYALARPGFSNIPPYDSELVLLHLRRIYQGLGVGQVLFRASVQCMHRKGCASMMLWVLEKNAPARRFYEHLGGELLAPSQLSQGIATEMAYGWVSLKNPS